VAVVATQPDVFPRLEISSRVCHPARPDVGLVRQRWLDVHGALVATGGTNPDGWWMSWPHLATYTFGTEGDVLAYPAGGSNPENIADSYARGVLPIVLLAREYEALHASGVSCDGHLTAFCAASGTGKSSLALAVAAQSGEHWADDTVILQSTPGRLDGVSLPFPARVDDAVRSCLGDRARRVRVVAPGRRAPLRRVYLLVRDRAVDPLCPVFTDVPAAQRFARLLAHAHPFDLAAADRRRRMIERLMHAAATASVCELRFGPSLAALPTLAARVRDHMAATGGAA
jgi:hypothetical protein